MGSGKWEVGSAKWESPETSNLEPPASPASPTKLGDDRVQWSRTDRGGDGGQTQLRQRPVGCQVVGSLLDGSRQTREDTDLV